MEFRVLGCGDAFASGGRLQTCFLLTSGTARALVDCGATALVSLQRAGVDASAIDAVFLTHLHGDHFGGVPFLLLDAVVGSGRDRPLIVAGPGGVERAVLDTLDLLYPGMASKVRDRRFASFAEWRAREPSRFGAWTVTPIPVAHAPALECYGVRVQLGGHVVACSGDTEWTGALFELASGADLFACECFTCTRRVAHHLSFDVLREQLPAFGARRTLLTHLGPEMLGCGAQVEAFARGRNIDVRCAHDDLVIEIP